MKKIGREIRELKAEIASAERKKRCLTLVVLLNSYFMFWFFVARYYGDRGTAAWLSIENENSVLFENFGVGGLGIIVGFLILRFRRVFENSEHLQMKKDELTEETLKACDAWD